MKIIPIISSSDAKHQSEFGPQACRSQVFNELYGIEHIPDYPRTMSSSNCVCESILIVVSFIVLGALLYSLLWHIYIQLQKTTHWLKILKSLKLQVFFLMSLVCLLQVLHYTINISKINRT